MGARVKPGGEYTFEVVGHGRIAAHSSTAGKRRDHVHLGTVEGVGPADLDALRKALVRWREEKPDFFGRPRRTKGDRVWLSLLPINESEFDRQLEDPHFPVPEYWRLPPTSPALLLKDDRLYVHISIYRGEKPDRRTLRRSLQPFLKRYDASCEISVHENEEYEPAGFTAGITLAPSFDKGTVADAWQFGKEAQTLLRVVKGNEIPRNLAVDLLCAGRWDLFYGQPESDWLEAKGAPYDQVSTPGDQWRYELAKDVAAFANSPAGGVIVLGMVTKDQGDGDVIRGHREFDLRQVKAAAYRRHVAQLVYPRVEGFEVRRIEGAQKKSHGLAILIVPPQPQSSRPFLVNGAISEGKVLGSHVLLPLRREDDTALADISALHARLRLGEQAIEGERRPGKSR